MMNELKPAVTVMPFRRRVRRVWTATALAEIVAAGFVLCVAGSFFMAPRTMKIYGESKVDIATLEVKKLANEAYPQWSRANAAHACPASLAELFPFDDVRHARDPWGAPYSFDCVSTGIVVRSPGEDGQYGTRDDIRSDE